MTRTPPWGAVGTRKGGNAVLQFEDDQPEQEDDGANDRNDRHGRFNACQGGPPDTRENGGIFGNPRMYHCPCPPARDPEWLPIILSTINDPGGRGRMAAAAPPT